MSRVVITGIGLVSPLGSNAKETWSNLIACKSGISKAYAPSFGGRCNVQYLGYVGDGISPARERVDPCSVLPDRERTRVGETVTLAYAAAHEAMEDSGWTVDNDDDAQKSGVVVGTGVGGAISLERAALRSIETPSAHPFMVVSALASSPAGFISSKLNFQAFNTTVVTACASGASAIVDAVNHIRMGHAEVVMAGGVEFSEVAICIGGFDAMMALSRKHEPHTASRPWDKDRDGFIMAEGSGMVVVEEIEHAKKRGAKIYAEVAGVGFSSDAFSLSAPEPSARGMIYAMGMAAKDAGISPEQIGYINAHSTSTPAGDRVEAIGVRKFMGDAKINMSSTKSSVGHMLGAAGAAEAIFTINAMNNGVMPATLNLYDPIEEVKGMNLAPMEPCENGNMDYVMSNSFGFGGSNVCLIFKKV